MSAHLVKLCVGAESIADLEEWQAARLHEMKHHGLKPEIMHITRQTPKREAELLDGGSLFWVIKGFICARQKLLELRPVARDGVPHCALVLHKDIVRVQPRPMRPFQGWRYLDAASAPRDLATGTGEAELPEHLRRELAALGLI